jgi:NTE family protein
MLYNPFNNKIGLALGGGAARGIAHIGVIKALEKNNVSVEYISGTSIGALIGSFYAFGKTPEEIEELIPELNFRKILNLTIPRKGFVSTDKVKNLILDGLGDVRVEDAKIPLAIVSTDIKTGEQFVFRKGPLTTAVCASVCVPGIFIPVEYQGRTLVDGGLTENVPISPLEDMGAGLTIAVNLNGVRQYPAPDDIISILGNAMDIAIDRRTFKQLEEADFVISMDLSRFTRLDNSQSSNELVELGEEYTKETIDKIFWYRKTKFYQFAKRLFFELLPLKVPKLFRGKELQE